MTDTATATSAADIAPYLEEVDPSVLLVDLNVRRDSTPGTRWAGRGGRARPRVVDRPPRPQDRAQGLGPVRRAVPRPRRARAHPGAHLLPSAGPRPVRLPRHARLRARQAQIAGLLDGATERRAEMVTLGMVLAAFEDNTGKHSWRNVDPSTAAYLRFLAEHGYGLSDVERLACGETPLPDADADTAA